MQRTDRVSPLWLAMLAGPLMGVLLARRGIRTTLASCAALVLARAVLVLTAPVLAVLVAGTALHRRRRPPTHA